MTDAELRALLVDCLAVWGITGRVQVVGDGIEIAAVGGVPARRLVLRRAAPEKHPIRWFLDIPGRDIPRALPSIVAGLDVLRSVLADPT